MTDKVTFKGEENFLAGSLNFQVGLFILLLVLSDR